MPNAAKWIFLTHSNNNNISRNIVTNSDIRIAVEESENNILFLNTISSSKYHGIYVSYKSNENTIRKNDLEENGDKGHGLSGSIYIDK